MTFNDMTLVHRLEHGLSPTEQRAWDNNMGELASATSDLGQAVNDLFKALRRSPTSALRGLKLRTFRTLAQLSWR